MSDIIEGLLRSRCVNYPRLTRTSWIGKRIEVLKNCRKISCHGTPPISLLNMRVLKNGVFFVKTDVLCLREIYTKRIQITVCAGKNEYRKNKLTSYKSQATLDEWPDPRKHLRWRALQQQSKILSQMFVGVLFVGVETDMG